MAAFGSCAISVAATRLLAPPCTISSCSPPVSGVFAAGKSVIFLSGMAVVVKWLLVGFLGHAGVAVLGNTRVIRFGQSDLADDRVPLKRTGKTPPLKFALEAAFKPLHGGLLAR